MQKLFLILLLGKISFNNTLHAQTIHPDSLYRMGMRAHNNNKYALADSLYTASIALKANPKVYVSRAHLKDRMKNPCAMCEDLAKASSMYYKEASYEYYDKCGKTDTVYYNRYSKPCQRDSARSMEMVYKAKHCSSPIRIHTDLYFQEFTSNVYFADTHEVFSIVDSMPVFPGGTIAYAKYIYTNIKVPDVVNAKAMKGKVYVKFVVTNEGDVKDVEVVKPMKDCPECSIEVVRLIRNMPKWQPGTIQGKPVSVHMILPIGLNSEGMR